MAFALISAISMLVVLGVMVLFHEAGHFVVAKLFGVRVEVFSIGFGKRLFGFHKGETDYRVSLLPLGGYVKMAGEMGGDGTVSFGGDAPGVHGMPAKVAELVTEGHYEAPPVSAVHYPSNDPGLLTSKPRWQRICIGLAGPVANFILAFALMTVFFMMHSEVPAYLSEPAVIDLVENNTPASKAGIKAGDQIIRFDKVENPTWEQIGVRSAVNLSQTVPVVVLRNGEQSTLSFEITDSSHGQDFSLDKLGFIPRMRTEPLLVRSVEADLPAARAGLKANDHILKVDDLELHSVPAVVSYLQENGGKPIHLKVDRAGQLLDFTVEPAKVSGPNGKDVYRLGFDSMPPPFNVEQLSLSEAASRSYLFNRNNSGLILEVLSHMLTRHQGMNNLSGPIGIARQTGMAVTMPGWQPIIELSAMISLNLGIFNLLPIPILDGGLILLLMIEGLIRRDLNQAFKERIYQVAFVLLVLCAVFVMFNDFTKLPIFSHAKP